MLHPGKLTCPLKRDYFNRKYIFQPSFFRGYVSFQGCSFRFFSPCNLQPKKGWLQKRHGDLGLPAGSVVSVLRPPLGDGWDGLNQCQVGKNTISPWKIKRMDIPKMDVRHFLEAGDSPSFWPRPRLFWVCIHSFNSGGTHHRSWRQEEGEDGGHLLLIVLVREHEQRLKMPKDPVKKQHSVFRHFFFASDFTSWWCIEATRSVLSGLHVTRQANINVI